MKKSSKQKAKRTTSNIFGMFSQNQLSEFKQAFQFIDSDKDGFINKNDIIATFDSLGNLKLLVLLSSNFKFVLIIRTKTI